MEEQGQENANGNQEIVARPRSTAIAERGVQTGEDFAGLMSALMSDVIEGRLSPSVANATCNAGGKLLKVVEMQYKYADAAGAQAKPQLVLAPLSKRDEQS